MDIVESNYEYVDYYSNKRLTRADDNHAGLRMKMSVRYTLSKANRYGTLWKSLDKVCRNLKKSVSANLYDSSQCPFN